MSGLLHAGARPGDSGQRTSQWEAHLRKARFVTVGVACFGFQYVVLRSLTAVGVPRPVGNGFGFALSAQLNFVLSSVFTWRDRRRDNSHKYVGSHRDQLINGSRWAPYNAVAVVALVVNVVVFTSSYELLGALVASAAGVVAGALVTYLVCDRVVFARSAGPALQQVES